LQLEASDVAPLVLRFNCESHTKFEVGQSIPSGLKVFLLLLLFICHQSTHNNDNSQVTVQNTVDTLRYALTLSFDRLIGKKYPVYVS